MASVVKQSFKITDDHSSWSKEEMVDKIRKLEAHVKQLRNVIAKSDGVVKKKRKKLSKNKRVFDFNKYNTRRVALKIAYLGWDYQGYTIQEDNSATVEAELFKALIYTRFIESRETSNYHRCGRTDSGVSAFSQVISLDLRTNLLEGPGVKVRENGKAHERKENTTTELAYGHILNRLLPPDIRVLAWCPVTEEFSARFSCVRRQYKYFFPRANIDIDAMREAGLKLQGTHDFRNLCKMDVGNAVTNYMRRINYVSLELQSDTSSPYDMVELTVDGKAFLWHQIRCVVAILLLVGQHKESPSVISELLDVERNPCKPQYSMASELPLVLYDCEFEDVDWIYEPDWLTDNIKHLQGIWTENVIRTSIIRRMLDHLEAKVKENDPDQPAITDHISAILCGYKSKQHLPLMQRKVCGSLEDRIEHFVKRRRIREVTPDESESSADESMIITESNNASPDETTTTTLENNDDQTF